MAEHNNIHNYNDDEYYYCPRNDCPCHDAPAGTLHVHLVSNDPSDLYSRAINYYDQLFGTYDQPRIADLNDTLLNTLGDAPDVPRVLVGSMKDLSTEEREVTSEEAQRLADSWKIPYVECSSKTGESVAEVFHVLLKEIERDEGLLTETGDGGCAIL